MLDLDEKQTESLARFAKGVLADYERKDAAEKQLPEKQLPKCKLCGAELLPSLTDKDSKHVCSVKEKFLQLLNEMSPENLACDGELSRSQIKKKLQGLKSEWKKFERQLGRSVSEDEILN